MDKTNKKYKHISLLARKTGHGLQGLESAPIWCSVDLRDGNQALIEPMGDERKKECLIFCVKLVLNRSRLDFTVITN